MFINEAFAATGEVAKSGSVYGTVIQFGLILLIFYVFLIRPQQKRIKEHNDMVESLKVGDRILTSGGIYGNIVKINGLEIEVEVSKGVNLTVDRMSVSGLVKTEKK